MDASTFISSLNDTTSSLSTNISQSLQSYSATTAEVSSSCDIMGMIPSFVSEITRSVRDSITGVVSEVTQSAADAIADIRAKLADSFSSNSGLLNTTISKAKALQQKIQEGIGKVSQWIAAGRADLLAAFHAAATSAASLVSSATAKIQTVMAGIRNAIAGATALVVKCVSALKQASCTAVASVLTATLDGGMSELAIDGDSTLEALQGAKDAVTNGASTPAEIASGATARFNPSSVAQQMTDDLDGADAAMDDVNGMDSALASVDGLLAS